MENGRRVDGQRREVPPKDLIGFEEDTDLSNFKADLFASLNPHTTIPARYGDANPAEDLSGHVSHELRDPTMKRLTSALPEHNKQQDDEQALSKSRGVSRGPSASFTRQSGLHQSAKMSKATKVTSPKFGIPSFAYSFQTGFGNGALGQTEARIVELPDEDEDTFDGIARTMIASPLRNIQSNVRTLIDRGMQMQEVINKTENSLRREADRLTSFQKDNERLKREIQRVEADNKRVRERESKRTKLMERAFSMIPEQDLGIELGELRPRHIIQQFASTPQGAKLFTYIVIEISVFSIGPPLLTVIPTEVDNRSGISRSWSEVQQRQCHPLSSSHSPERRKQHEDRSFKVIDALTRAPCDQKHKRYYEAALPSYAFVDTSLGVKTISATSVSKVSWDKQVDLQGFINILRTTRGLSKRVNEWVRMFHIRDVTRLVHEVEETLGHLLAKESDFERLNRP